jgi:hypothetical protein
VSRLLVFLVGSLITSRQAYSQNPRFDPTSAYRRVTIEGFTVLINPQVSVHTAIAAEVQRELKRQLKAIKRVVPAERLAKVRKVRIWVEWDRSLKEEASLFHPSRDWLVGHDYNPDKAEEIEISNASKYVEWSRAEQPWLLLHELAHAYHFRVLGYDHPGIEAAFENAKTRGLYRDVCHVDGSKKKVAYAVADTKKVEEYFAELTEAYFGLNDYFPFTRSKLKEHDPDGHKVLVEVWGQPLEPR